MIIVKLHFDNRMLPLRITPTTYIGNMSNFHNVLEYVHNWANTFYGQKWTRCEVKHNRNIGTIYR